MTVLTFSALNAKKAGELAPANGDKKPLVTDVESNNEGQIPKKKSPLIVTMRARQRVHRINSMTTICVFLTALLVFTTGIVGGYYLYRQFTQYKTRHYRGWCSIPYDRAELLSDANKDQSMSSYFSSLKSLFPSSMIRPSTQSPMAHRLRADNPMDSAGVDDDDDRSSVIDRYMDEEFDIDLEFEEFERIEVPNFGLGSRGRFIHDFKVNLTGIVDLDNLRCFVLPLNRDVVMPPKNLADMMQKIQAGEYNVDTAVVRQSYRVITPEITDYKTVGYYIARECGLYPTYLLEKSTSMRKRSINKPGAAPIFSEFAGRKIMEFHIDASNAPGKRVKH